jgi:hypothetical protein
MRPNDSLEPNAQKSTTLLLKASPKHEKASNINTVHLHRLGLTPEVTRAQHGDDGNTVIKYFDAKKNNKSLVTGRIDYMIELIESARDPWLRSMIAVRDTLTYKRPYVHFGFSWDSVTSTIKPPMADVDGTGIPVSELMEVQLGHLIGYVREFSAWTLACAIPLEIHLQPMEDTEKIRMTGKCNMDLMNAKYILRWPSKRWLA